MNKFLLIFLSLVLCLPVVYAQYAPANGDTVNYRFVSFSFPASAKAVEYRLEIAQGVNNNEVFFKKNIITSSVSKDSRFIEMLPAFSQSYTWRITWLNKKGKETGKTHFQHFHIGSSKYTDTTRFRVRLIDTGYGYDSLFMFMDCTRTINDINGLPIWYLPDIPGIVNENSTVRDLKVTPFSTITFLADNRAVEIDYNGNVLWQAPNSGKVSGDTSEYYHHEFTRLKNGNYMVAGHYFEYRQLPDQKDTSVNKIGVLEKRGNIFFKKLAMGSLIEYNAGKDIIWYWKSGEYFSDADLFTKQTYRGLITSSTHMNGFYFDESNKVIYTTYRDVNRIVKISYPSGMVLAAYGENFTNNNTLAGDGWFYGIHHPTILADGTLCIFNNNHRSDHPADISEKQTSTILIIREPYKNSEQLSIISTIRCNIDTFATSHSGAGGSVYELPNRDLLTCMGSANRTFIIDRKNNIKWNALYEMRNEQAWIPYSCYRISPLPHQQLVSITLKRK
jgi:hypothetical protein